MIPVEMISFQQVKIKVAFLYLQLYFFFVPSVIGFKLSPFRGEPNVRSTVSQTNIDLVSLLHGNPTEGNEILSEAIQLLNSMQSAPSCNQRAASSLITSCQAFSAGGNDRKVSSSVELDHLKSLYAARLAVCEVMGAGAAVPEQCTPILPGGRYNKPGLESHYRESQVPHEDHPIPYRQLEICLKSLESKPQWWTSYSNSRQNAVVMCQAARFDVEKEELLDHHRTLTEISFGLRDVLNRSVSDALGQSARHKSFLETIEKMRLKFLHDVQENNAFARAEFMALFTGSKGILENANDDFRKFMDIAVSDVAILSKNIRLFETSINQLKQVIRDAHAERLKHSSEIAKFEKVTLQTNANLAATLHQSLEEMTSLGMKVMAEEVGRLHTSLYSLNDDISILHNRHNSLDERIQQFDLAFRGFENRAITLEHIMISQIMNHTRLQQSFQTDILATQALLVDITSSATELQSTIEEARRSFENIPFKSSMGLIGWWPYCVIVLCVLSVFSPKFVAKIAYLCLVGISLLCMGAFDWFRTMEKYALNTIRAASTLEAACFTLGFVISAITIILIVTRGCYLIPATWAMRYSRVTANDVSNSIALP